MERNSALDAMRFIGFLAVALLHVVSRPDMQIGFPAFIDHATRFAVPLYFMISGYLFEKSRRPTLEKWKRSAVRLALIFVIWEIIYNLVNTYYLHIFSASQNIAVFLARTLVSGGVAWHLWFLPSLGLCMTIFAVLRTFGWKVLFAVAIVLFALGLAIDAYASVLGVSDFLKAHGVQSGVISGRDGPFFGTIFFATGAFVATISPMQKSWKWLALGIFGLVLQMLEAYMLSRTGTTSFAPFNFLASTLPFSIGIFLYFLSLPFPPFVAALGRVALGMYCCHVLFLSYFEREGAYLADFRSDFSKSVLMYVLVVVLSAALALILSRNPVTRKIVQ